MADSKLSSLTAASALTGTELFYSDDGSADVKVTATQLKTFAVGAGSVSVATGKTLTASNTLTFTGTDSSSVAFGAGGTVLYSGGALGTPSSGTLTNATGLPVGGISATGTPSASTYLRGDGSWQSVSAAPGGSSTQVQFNDGGAFGGDSRFTFNKTTNVLELTGSIKLDGATLYANGGFPYIATAVGSTTQFQAAGGVAAAGAGLFGFTSNSTNALTTVDASIKRGGGAGILTLGNAATPTDFDRLQFGGTTSSFPALKRSTTTLQVRLADDSAFAPISSSLVVLNGSSSGAVTVQGAAAAGTWTLTLPTSAGTNGYVLSTNGSGVTSWVAQSGGGSGSPGGSDTQIQFNNSSAFGGSSSLTWNDTTKLLTVTGLGTGGGANTGGLTISGGAMTLSGNISANAWTTSGIRYKSVAATLTDLTSSGTVAAAYTNVYGGNTIAASSATTFTDYFTTFITQPTAGTNVTFTNRWALGTTGSVNVGGPTLRLGGVDSGAATAQTLQVQSSTGTNTAGAAFTVAGSRGTGTGAGGSIIFQVAPAGSSGTAQNALATALTIDSTRLATFARNITFGANSVSLNGGFGTAFVMGVTGARFGINPGAGDGWRFGPNNIGMGSADADVGSNDVILARDAANTLALKNSTNPQIFRAYSTTASSGSYGYMAAGVTDAGVATADTLFIGSGGAGAAMTKFAVAVNGTTRLSYGVVGASTWSASGTLYVVSTGGSPNLNGWDDKAVLRSTGNYWALSNGASNEFEIYTYNGGTFTNPAFRITQGGVPTLCNFTATPSGGSTSARVLMGTTAGFGIYYGSGAPTVTAAKGSIYLRSDGSGTSDRMYINTDGSTTWTAVTTAA